MSIKPSGLGQPQALPKAPFELDLDKYRSESGTQDFYKVSEKNVALAFDNPADNIYRVLPGYIATDGLKFVLGGAGDDSKQIEGHLIKRNSLRRYKLDHDDAPKDEDGREYSNSRIIDEAKLKFKYPGPIKKKVMRMLGREAMVKVSFSLEDGVAIDFLRNISAMTEATDVSELDELYEEAFNDAEYSKIRARNLLIGELKQDWNPKTQKFKIVEEVKEADLDFVPVVPDKSWVNDAYKFLRENDQNDPLAVLRQDWDEETQSFRNSTEQRKLFGQLATQMNQSSVDLFVHGHEALAQLAGEMDPVTVNEFNRLKSNDKFVQEQQDSRYDDDDDDYYLSAIL